MMDLGVPNIFQLPYNALSKKFRVLWHQTIDRLVRYKYLPHKTTNFDFYPLYKKRTKTDITLSSTVVTKFAGYIDDCIIRETWTANDISMETGFFYELMALFKFDLSVNDKLIWYPKDQTDKAFVIEILDIIAGDSADMDVNPIHHIYQKDYRFLTVEIVFMFKIQKIEDIPEVALILGGV